MSEEQKERWSSRKFLTMVVLEMITTALLWVGKIGPEHWVEVTSWLAAAYFVANVGQRFAEKRNAGS